MVYNLVFVYIIIVFKSITNIFMMNFHSLFKILYLNLYIKAMVKKKKKKTIQILMLSYNINKCNQLVTPICLMYKHKSSSQTSISVTEHQPEH